MFQHRLAALLNRSKAELLAGISYREYLDWLLFYEAEPWGDRRADERLSAAIMWLKSKAEFSTENLPELNYPYFRQQDVREAVDAAKETIEALKRGDHPSQTRGSAARGHAGLAEGIRAGEGGNTGV